MSDQAHISRRELLRGRFIGSVLKNLGHSMGDVVDTCCADKMPPSSIAGPTRNSKSFPILRPPGAIEEDSFLDGCTRCDACVKACPHDAIIHAPARYRRAAGTPMIDPSPAGKPCMMCEDFPCITSCEPNVLRMSFPKQMGQASIDVFTCLAHQNSFCTVCSEQCPVDGAIEIVNNKPRIVESNCTGCGVCQHVCPAPANAILLMPLAQRSKPPNGTVEADVAMP